MYIVEKLVLVLIHSFYKLFQEYKRISVKYGISPAMLAIGMLPCIFCST